MVRGEQGGELAFPGVQQGGAAGRVVVEQVGHAEPAEQVEGGLHRLADPGAALVHVEQRDGEPVHLPTHPCLQWYQRAA